MELVQIYYLKKITVTTGTNSAISWHFHSPGDGQCCGATTQMLATGSQVLETESCRPRERFVETPYLELV